jgi:Golgi phosphoprotein 3
MASSTLHQRKKGAGGGLESPNTEGLPLTPSSPLEDNSNNTLHGEFVCDSDGFTKDEVETRRVKLTLMDEVLLLGLKDEQGYLSFWNDNISYVLRGCILMELAFRGKITIFKEPGGKHLRKPPCDRLIELINDSLTGEILLDEAIKIMRMDKEKDPSNRVSITEWIDLLSGETWNILKSSYQLKQVRERLAKGLVDKGVLRTEKKNFLLFEMPTHPLSDGSVKKEIINRIMDCLLVRGSPPTRRTIALCCAAYAANVIENIFNGSNMGYNYKDSCFARCEDMMSEWSGVPKGDLLKNSVDNSKIFASPSINPAFERAGWNEIAAGVVAVFLKMDSML